MEYFAAGLTAVLLVAFIRYLFRGAQSAARQSAGRVLLKVLQRTQWRSVSVIFSFMSITLFIFCMTVLSCLQFFRPSSLPIRPFTVFFFVLQLYQPWLILPFLPFFRKRLAFCEHGIIRPVTHFHVTFVSWDQIRYCQWLDEGTTLLVQAKDHKFEIEIAPEKVAAVNSVLMDHVDARNCDGQTLNLDRLPFHYVDNQEPRLGGRQFNLKTLLFFMVVASSAFSWMGIHRQKGWQKQSEIARFKEKEKEVFERLKKFGVTANMSRDRIRSLDFSKCSKTISDDDLRELSAFKELRFLNLRATPITDAGLAHIFDLPNLSILFLSNTRVSDAGIAHLQKLPKLNSLYLSGTSITDASFGHLKEMPELKSLDLSKTSITDAGLEHLEMMNNLILISMNGTQVTKEGKTRLQEKLPRARIR